MKESDYKKLIDAAEEKDIEYLRRVLNDLIVQIKDVEVSINRYGDNAAEVEIKVKALSDTVKEISETISDLEGAFFGNKKYGQKGHVEITKEEITGLKRNMATWGVGGGVFGASFDKLWGVIEKIL